jgi:hypothetical protein
MAVRQGLPGSLAARVTYLLEPKNWLIVTVVGIGAHTDGLAGAAWPRSRWRGRPPSTAPWRLFSPTRPSRMRA